MKEFKGKVAVVTGAASGIGYALAQRGLEEGMKVMISDVRADALAKAEKTLKAIGDVSSMVVDVRKAAEVEALAKNTVEAFGKVNLVFNNAGMFATGITWELSIEEYQLVIETNLMSMVYGIKSFVPRMIAQGDECHVINTASNASMAIAPGFCTYSTTKHAALALTECLYVDLIAHKVPNVGVTVVMPGVVQSDIMNPDKVAPNDRIAQELATRLKDPINKSMEEDMRTGVANGMPAAEAADMVYKAILNNELYVLPNAQNNEAFYKMLGEARATGNDILGPIFSTQHPG